VTTASKPSPPRKHIPIPQQKLVWMYSAGQCCFPGCTIRAAQPATEIDGDVVIGEVAHIHAYEDEGPRANPDLTLEARNSYANLLLLCPNHHTIVDKQAASYPADTLRKWKREIEGRVTDALRNAMPQVDFAELKLITVSLLVHEGSFSQDLTVIPPAEKLKKNQLSHTTHAYLSIALAKASVVRQFIDAFTKLEDTFSARLRSGFINAYETLKRRGITGDELFQEMLSFATGSKSDLKSQAAGLAILGYYFESCEVFEK
jgi:HNH endonuclease